MSIVIKQTGDKWRLELRDEEWVFESREDMEKGLKILLDMKNKGRVRKNEIN